MKRKRLLVLLALGGAALAVAGYYAHTLSLPQGAMQLAPPVDMSAGMPVPVVASGREAVLGLEATEPDDDGGTIVSPAVRGLMAREIGRQAVLIAARHGLGLATRDQVLREPYPSDDEADAAGDAGKADAAAATDMSVGVLRAETLALRGESFQVDLFGGPGAKKHVWARSVPLRTGRYAAVDYVALLEQVEPLSRVEMVSMLKQTGFAGR